MKDNLNVFYQIYLFRQLKKKKMKMLLKDVNCRIYINKFNFYNEYLTNKKKKKKKKKKNIFKI